jgi:hypothetical protein
MSDFLETTRRVKAGSQLVGERLVLGKTVCACCRDGALVEVHGIERASLDTGNLTPTAAARSLKFCGQFAAQARSCRSCLPSASRCLAYGSGPTGSHYAARDSAA